MGLGTLNFKELITDIKILSSTLAAIAMITGFGYAVYGHFHTDAEAAVHVLAFEDYQKAQYQADKFDRLDRVQREIDRIDFQLISEDLTSRQREYLESKRRDLEKKMECIRRDEC